jgi:hypothetical protein
MRDLGLALRVALLFNSSVTQARERIHHMLPVINALHHFSIINPTLYFGTLLVLLLIVLRDWYRLGSMNALAVTSPAPQAAAARPRFVFYCRSTAVVLQIANLLILGSIESKNDTIAATIAVRVT